MKKLTGAFGWLLIAVCVAVSPTAMAQEWIGWGGHSYALTSANDMSWQECVDEADAAGGYLVTINSAAENTWLATTFNVGYFAGGNDKTTEGQWRWIENDVQFWQGASTGSAVGGAYENWNGSWNTEHTVFTHTEPNDSGGEDEMEVNAAGGWNDNSGSEHYGVMEKNVAVPPVVRLAGGIFEEGSYVALVAVVSNTGSTAYHFAWTHNGAPVGTDSNQILIDEVEAADAGVYGVTVTDDWTPGGITVYCSLQVVAPGTLPVGGMLGLSLLAAACALGGARVLRRK